MRPEPGIEIQGHPDVYQPAEDSYLLLAAVSVRPGERFLEVGAGTGLIALHAARITHVVATDANPRAVALLQENARKNGLRVEAIRTDLMAGLRGPFDVVAFNPPYLEGHARENLERAWLGGDSGSAVAMRFLKDLPRVLAPAGRAYLLLSRANVPARDFAESMFCVKALVSKDLFFEKIEVLELSQRLE